LKQVECSRCSLHLGECKRSDGRMGLQAHVSDTLACLVLQSRDLLEHSQAAIQLIWSLWCMNPGIGFKPIAAAARSVILASGTLSPFTSFQSELGCAFSQIIDAPHVINVAQQMCVSAVTHGPNGQVLNAGYANVDGLAFQDQVGEAILQYCTVIPHGVLCFLPSYSLLFKLHSRWKQTGLWKRLQELKKIVVGMAQCEQQQAA
jgi:Rad3-related DNA helicase